MDGVFCVLQVQVDERDETFIFSFRVFKGAEAEAEGNDKDFFLLKRKVHCLVCQTFQRCLISACNFFNEYTTAQEAFLLLF